MKAKLWSVSVGAIVAGAGAGGAYLLGWLSSADAATLGPYGPLAGMLLSVVVNAARKAMEPTPPDAK